MHAKAHYVPTNKYHTMSGVRDPNKTDDGAEVKFHTLAHI